MKSRLGFSKIEKIVFRFRCFPFDPIPTQKKTIIYTIFFQRVVLDIVKLRQPIKHFMVVNEVINALSNDFQPTVSDIKDALDVLLEKEYIGRADGDKDTYIYIP